ncbi:MAG: CRISPR system precrRNA processing endoribonuclease RAMP protein Cas6 [Promethearchaeota archaeon]
MGVTEEHSLNRFIQLRFYLYPLDNSKTIKKISPPVVRALFLKLLSQADADLAKKLHDMHGIPPYTTQLKVKEDSIMISFNLFNEEVIVAFQRALFKLDEYQFHLKDDDVILTKVYLDVVKLEDLLKDIQPVKKFKLIFTKLTYLKQKNGVIVLYPFPKLLFKNLVHIWNEITGALFPIDVDPFIRWVEQHVRVSSYKLKTGNIQLGQKSAHSRGRFVTGFKGWARFLVSRRKLVNEKYLQSEVENADTTNLDNNSPVEPDLKLKDESKEGVKRTGTTAPGTFLSSTGLMNEKNADSLDFEKNCKIIDLLLKFARFSNIGGTRTAGLGTIVYIPENLGNKTTVLYNNNENASKTQA